MLPDVLFDGRAQDVEQYITETRICQLDSSLGRKESRQVYLGQDDS